MDRSGAWRQPAAAARRALLLGAIMLGVLAPATASGTADAVRGLSPLSGDGIVLGPPASSRPPVLSRQGTGKMPALPGRTAPVQVLRVSPGNGTTETPRATPIVVFFDRPMVPLAALEAPAPAAPARIDPPIAGYGRWLNTATWTWYPQPSLRGATRYTVTVPAGLRAVDGATLAAPYSSTFSTPRPSVARVSPSDTTPYADFRAPITVLFNQSVDRASAQAAFALRDASSAQVAGAFAWPRPDTLVFHPATWLTLGTRYSAAVGAGLRSAEGPLAASGGSTWNFTTAALPTVASTAPANGDRSADMSQGLALSFAAPVDPRLLARRLRLLPRPGNMSINMSQDGLTATIYGSFAPSTHYHLALDGVIGTYGQALPHPFRMGFITAPLPAAVQLSYSNGIVSFDAYRPVDIGVAAVNTRAITTTLYTVSRQDFIGLNQNVNVQSFIPVGKPLFTVRQRVSAPLNKTVGVGQELSSPGERLLRPGFYFLRVQGDQGGSDQMAFIVTRTALTFKTAADRALVWATDLHSGKPLPGLLARIVRADTGGLVAAGHTGPDGVLDVGYAPNQSATLVALLDRPGDASAVSAYWGSGVQPGDYNLPNATGMGTLIGHLGYLYTDRPIYRPGQPIHYRGLVRRDDDGAYGLQALGTPVRVTLTDSTGHTIYTTLTHLDRFGAFAGTVTPGSGAALGQDNLNAQIGNQAFSTGFAMAEYRKPGFTVAASPANPGGNATNGQPVRVSVAARYLFGAPLNRAKVHWSVITSDLYFSPAAYPDYTFQDYPELPYQPFAIFSGTGARLPGYPAPYSPGGYMGGMGGDGFDAGPLCIDFCGGGYTPPNVVAQGNARTDGKGNLTLSIPANLRRYQISQQWSVEADVSDVNDESISSRAVVDVHKALFYAGLRGPSALVVAGQPAHVDLLTLAQNGTTLLPNVALTMKLYRRTYRVVYVRAPFGGTEPQWQPVDTLLKSFPAATGASGHGVTSVPLPDSGEYRLAAEARDARGNLVRSAISLYAAGRDETISPWANPPQDRIRLVPDRALYRIGEVARVLVAAPRPRMTALVTIERGRVYSHRVLRLAGTSPILRIPILPSYLPNVFVSVVVVAGTGPHADTPLWKMGLAELPVDVRERQLRLTLSTDTARAHPGQPLTIHLHAAGPDGRPVSGAFSLGVVDEAVLSLAAEQAPAILDGFYAERGLGVQTAYTQNIAAFQLPLSALKLNAAAREKRFAQNAVAAPARGGGGGGGAGGPSPRLRTYFPDTAYWNPDVRTDAAGNATVTVTMPDSLTTWRIMARGLTADTLVGQASIDILSTRDLLLRPVLPRFFALGDAAQVGAVVNNTTARPLTARVTLAVSGEDAQGTGRVVSHPSIVVTIAPGGERLVTWPLHPVALGSLRVTLTAMAAGIYGDAVAVTAPVEPNSTPEVVATSGQAGASRLEQVRVPSGVEQGEGGLTLTVQPSLAAGLRSSVDYLQHYPYESNEDLAARLMGEVSLLRLPATATGLNVATLAAYRRDVGDTIALLLDTQRADGGWGWWAGDLYSSPAISTFCLDALSMARRAGYSVPEQPLRQARGYVGAVASQAATAPLATPSGIDGVTPDLSAYMAYVLAANGDGSAADALFSSRGQVPLWSRAYLLRALYLENGGRLEARGRTVLAELEAAAHLDAAGAHWEDSGDAATTNDPVQATAEVLDALVEADPSSPLIAPATRWLVAARGGEVWPTTVDNAVALRALSDELRGSGELGGRYSYAAILGGQPWGGGTVDAATLARPRVLTAPMGLRLAPGSDVRVRLTRSNTSGRLYYTLRLAYYPPVDRVGALDRGIAITRQYLYNGRAVSTAPAGAVLRVRLTISSAQDLFYVKIEDPLPAGAEAVDPTLLTTSQLQSGGYRLPPHTSDLAWYVSHAELRDDRAAIFVGYLPAGVYRYEYTVQLTTRGVFHALPVHVEESYFPEVFGRGTGSYFTVR